MASTKCIKNTNYTFQIWYECCCG